jgi:hypothetical protein
MNILEFVISLRPAVPMSQERPCTQASNSEIRRWIKDGSIQINRDMWTPSEDVPPVIYSVVFFPKSRKRCTTVL